MLDFKTWGEIQMASSIESKTCVIKTRPEPRAIYIYIYIFFFFLRYFDKLCNFQNDTTIIKSTNRLHVECRTSV